MSKDYPINRCAAGSRLSTEGGRILALDSLRGLCAIAVALHHFKASGFIADNSLVHNAFLFVDFFFVLSGFVIARAYLRPLADQKTKASDFIIKRIARIYPLHIAMIVPFLLVEIIIVPQFQDLRTPFSVPMDLPALGVNLLMLNSVNLTNGTTWNYPSWSIGAEFLTYIGFAIVVAALGRRSLWAMPVIALISFAVLANFSPDYIDATHDLGAIRCAFGFSIGVLVWRILEVRPFRLAPPIATALEIAAIVAVVAFVAMVGSRSVNLLTPVLFAPVIVLFASGAGILSRILTTRSLVFLGTISYSIYMVHAFVASRIFSSGLEVLDRRLGISLFDTLTGRFGTTPEAGNTLTLLYLLTVISAATVTYYLVERPGLAIVRPLAFLRDHGLNLIRPAKVNATSEQTDQSFPKSSQNH